MEYAIEYFFMCVVVEGHPACHLNKAAADFRRFADNLDFRRYYVKSPEKNGQSRLFHVIGDT